MELLDVCSAQRWQTLEDGIRAISGLNASVYNIHGYRINPAESWPNRLCPAIKANPKGQSFICATAHMNLANEARLNRSAVIEACDAGMVKVVVPVFVGETFLGAVGGCGLLPEQDEIDTFVVHKITGMQEEEVEDLAQGVASISTSKAREVVEFIEKQLEEILAAFTSKR